MILLQKFIRTYITIEIYCKLFSFKNTLVMTQEKYIANDYILKYIRNDFYENK